MVDDPHNPTQAESDVQREAARTYFSRTLSTRLDDKRRGALVVIMQRLHERDLAALCLDLDFTHVCLPATAEHRTTVTFPRSGRQVIREPGAVLWPAREDHPELEAQRRLLGSAAYAGQYQQQPVPPGGLLFQRTWWQFYDALPDRLNGYAQSWDMAFKGGPDNDYVVGLTAARRGADIYLIDRVKGQWDFTTSCRQVVAFRRRYPKVTEILVEEAANGAAIVNALRNQLPGLIAVRPEGRQGGPGAGGGAAGRGRQRLSAPSAPRRAPGPRARLGRGLSGPVHRLPQGRARRRRRCADAVARALAAPPTAHPRAAFG